jgi:hypothetical protein
MYTESNHHGLGVCYSLSQAPKKYTPDHPSKPKLATAYISVWSALHCDKRYIACSILPFKHWENSENHLLPIFIDPYFIERISYLLSQEDFLKFWQGFNISELLDRPPEDWRPVFKVSHVFMNSHRSQMTILEKLQKSLCSLCSVNSSIIIKING